MIRVRAPASRRARHGLASRRPGCLTVALLALALPLWGGGAAAQEPATSDAAALQARRIELQPQLRANAFGEPVHLSSREAAGQVQGDVHAEVEHPFADLSALFTSAQSVCGMLFLHLNVRACRPSATAAGELLTLTLGPKRAQPSDVRYPMDYAMQVEAASPDYLRVTLSAAQGPLATRDYRIVFEAVPIGPSSSFLHLGYAYGTSALSRLAMELYLATAGRSKFGFSVVGRDEEGQPLFVMGERAALERNVLRYFLAVVAYAGVKTGSPQERMDQRLRAWFALTERHAAQLHELDLDEYLREKHDDLASHPP